MSTPNKAQLSVLRKVTWSRDCTKDFQTIEKLGEGSYGAVFHSIHVPTGTHCAIKTVTIDGDIGSVGKEIV